MPNLDNEQNLGKSGEQVSQAPLIECKYDRSTGDIFLFLTREGLKELKSGKLLKTSHPQTGASFSLHYNPRRRDKSQELDVLAAIPQDEVFLIELSRRGYNRLTDLAYEDARAMGDNRFGAPRSRINVVIDNEMVGYLAKDRAERAKTVKPLFEDRGIRNGYRITVMNPDPIV